MLAYLNSVSKAYTYPKMFTFMSINMNFSVCMTFTKQSVENTLVLMLNKNVETL